MNRFYSRSVLVVLASIFAYVCLQNFFKWIPFPAGRTAFNLTTLEENMVSVVAGVALFSTIIGLLTWPVWRTRDFRKQDALVSVFLAFLFFQIWIRDSLFEEFARSCALGASLLSSVLIGKYFGETTERLQKFLSILKWALLISILLGLVVAVLRPVSVNWGFLADGPCESAMLCRSEFFFFTINPLLIFVLLWREASKTRRLRIFEIFSALTIVTLTMMTRTRQYTLTIMAATALMFALWAKNKKRVIYAALAGVVVLGALLGPTIFHKAMQYSRLAVDPQAVKLDPNTADWSSGRMQLLGLLIKTYKQSSVLGVGGVKVRTLIDQAHLNARTEHGFAFYLATYGVFGLLFIFYIGWAFARAIRILWFAIRSKIDASSPHVTLALIAVPLFPFGFFGLFGSATNATDWICLVIAALISHSKVFETERTI